MLTQMNIYCRHTFIRLLRCFLHIFFQKKKVIRLCAVSLSFTFILLSLTYICLFANFSPAGWEEGRSRYIPLYIHPDEKTTLIEPTDVCKENSPVLLIIVIHSAPNNFEARQTLRETWANTTEFNYPKFVAMHAQYKGQYLPINYPDWRKFVVRQDTNVHDVKDDPSQENFRIRIVFLIGQTKNNDTQDKIVKESRTHNDLIQESFLDSYNNLTLKSVMMLKWINDNCAEKVKFVMKCDDDSFVNVPNLIHFLMGGTIPVYKTTLRFYNDETLRTLDTKNRLSEHTNLLIGHRYENAEPIRFFLSKWFVPHYMYDARKFPKFVCGSGYVFSADTAVKLYSASLETPLVYLEDVFVTGICAERAHIQSKHCHLFDVWSYETLCECKGMLTKHQVEIDDMRRAYDFVVNPKEACT